MALSHCWGSSPSFTTTKATRKERSRGVDLPDLPQNFQDAIIITRKLGIPYIWIDSVCIVQDDSDDWEREAAKMLDVYKNSFLTIAAMSAENSHEGFLHRRKAPTRFSCEIPFQSSKSQAHGRVIVCWPPSGIGPDILATRGWTLQELIFPSRVLHFSAEQMVWDCERQIREDGQSPLIAGHLGSKIRAEIRSNTLMSLPYSRWYSLVENYTSRDITKPTDKLPAISGLALEICRTTGDQYLAGLWKHDLVAGLMWTPCENKKLKRITSHYRGPSWSWAAVDGRISYAAALRQMDQEFSLEVKEVAIVTAGPSQLGAVKHGFLKVNCFLRETTVGSRNVFGLYDFEDRVGSYLPDDGEDPQGASIWCMKVIQKEYNGDSNVQMHPYGLALQPTGPWLGTEFERVWTFKVDPRSDSFSDCEKKSITIF